MWAVIKDGDHTLTWCPCFRELIGRAVKINEDLFLSRTMYYIDGNWAHENSDEPYDVCDVFWNVPEFDMTKSNYLNELLSTNHLTSK